MDGYTILLREESVTHMCSLLFHLAMDLDAKFNNMRSNIL